MSEWTIEYYDGKLPLTKESSKEKNYQNVRLDGVVFVQVSRTFQEQKQTIKLSGFDYYFIDFPLNKDWCFGGWSERNNGSGYRYIWPINEQVILKKINVSELQNEIILESIFVPRPDSITLNLENEEDQPILPGE